MIKGFLFLLGGTIVAQGLALIATPFLAQLYGPSLFGSLAIVVSCVTIFSSIGSFKLDLAIQNIVSIKDYQANVYTAFVVNILISLLLVPVLLFIAVNDISFLGGKFDYTDLIFLFVGCVGIIFYNLAISCALRVKTYKKVGLSKTILVLSMLLLQFTLYPISTSGLIIGYSLAFIFPILLLYSNFKRVHSIKIFECINICKSQYKFTLYTNISSLVNAVGNQMHILFFAAYYGVTMVGLLMLSQKIISAPIKMIADAISKIIYTNEVNMHEEKAILFANLMVYVLFCSIPVFVIMYYFIEPLIIWAFGADWSEASEYSKYAIVLGGLTLIGMPLYNISLKIGYNKSGMIFEFCMMIMRVVVLLITFFLNLESNTSVMILFLSGSFLWLLYVIYTFIILRVRVSTIFICILLTILYTLSLYYILYIDIVDYYIIISIYTLLTLSLLFRLIAYVKNNNF